MPYFKFGFPWTLKESIISIIEVICVYFCTIIILGVIICIGVIGVLIYIGCMSLIYAWFFCEEIINNIRYRR